MTDAERCVLCNDVIPEGRQVCPVCEVKIISNKGKKTMNNNEKTTQYTTTPDVEPADKVKYDVKGVYTKFQKNRAPKNSIHECRLLASVEEGIVSVSMAQEKGVMLTVRFDEMLELITEALNKAREVKAMEGEKK